MFYFPGIHPGRDRIIAATGAGGKSSCLNYLSRQLQQQGKRVLLTTTTRIYRPAPDHLGSLIYRLIDHDLSTLLWHSPPPGTITVAGHPDSNPEKLLGIEPSLPKQLIEHHIYDNILIEADGSKHLPLKAPSEKEPVIPENCQVVIGITGWQGLQQKAAPAHTHRWPYFSKVTGLQSGDSFTAEALCRLINSDNGLFKNTHKPCRKIWLINQLDKQEDRIHACHLARQVQLLSPDIPHCLLARFGCSHPWLKSADAYFVSSYDPAKEQ
ncbi:hypothetical protein CI610_02211 [invertebrate metagenome]|uniref:Selenium-dependent hydroxylase accessory protein YqeC n=1 Tax=invertebrate metagenome TaxID=1711999 RepID=A0A2H9T6L0_9ZZZZ